MVNEKDGVGTPLSSAGPTRVWGPCYTTTTEYTLRYDVHDIVNSEEDGTIEVILREMGDVISVG